jgi:hypothetical protein
MTCAAIVEAATKNKALAEDFLLEPALAPCYPELIKMIAESRKIIKQYS